MCEFNSYVLEKSSELNVRRKKNLHLNVVVVKPIICVYRLSKAIWKHLRKTKTKKNFICFPCCSINFCTLKKNSTNLPMLRARKSE